MIDKVKFRELWEANNGPNPGRELFLHCGEPHSDLIDFLLSHASELLALVEADGWRRGLTIEPHGDGHAVYSGRDHQHHGHRLFNVTDATQVGINVITGLIGAPPPEPGHE